MADDAGALLVRSGLVSASALEDARARVHTLGGTLGEQLVLAGTVGDDALTDFYRQRLLVPQVNPNTLARLAIAVVSKIPADLAIELRAVPVSIDGDNNLTVAMGDPSDRHAVDQIAFFTGAYVVRAVATQMQIAWCLARYYGHVTKLGERLLQPANAAAGTPAPLPAASPMQPSTGAGGGSLIGRARVKGLTGKVNAARHRAVAPITGPIDVPRPSSEVLEPPVPAPPPAPEKPLRASSPAITVIAGDGVPERPRARSVSGEIRVPVARVRAQSIKPPMPPPHLEDGEDDDEPTISIEESGDDDGTAPRMLPVRRRVKSDPPELRARGGEISSEERPRRPSVRRGESEPRIIISDEALVATPTTQVDDTSVGVVIHDYLDHESEPVLLEQKRRPPTPQDEDEVVVLEARKKTPTPRPVSRTVVGVAPPTAAAPRAHRDTETAAVPSMVDDGPTAAEAYPEDGPTRVDAFAAPARGDTLDDDDDDDDDDAHDEDDDDEVVELSRPASASTARRFDYDPSDDGWGPPGTTIPPPLLGALPGIDEDDADSGAIPMPSLNTAPLIVAPPSPPEPARGSPALPEASGPSLVRALEDATSRAIQLIRTLERARDRDGVITLMISHLAEAHMRAGFFSIRPIADGNARATELAVFKIEPGPPVLPTASLRLDRPSTLQDVVGTRLPYRGPMHDDASRQFLTAVLGAPPPEILLVPVTVRERVVGVLFGEHRMRHTFDDQLALAARAAGMALERILLAKRS